MNQMVQCGLALCSDGSANSGERTDNLHCVLAATQNGQGLERNGSQVAFIECEMLRVMPWQVSR